VAFAYQLCGFRRLRSCKYSFVDRVNRRLGVETLGELVIVSPKALVTLVWSLGIDKVIVEVELHLLLEIDKERSDACQALHPLVVQCMEAFGA
jgi:hypothetical protein